MTRLNGARRFLLLYVFFNGYFSLIIISGKAAAIGLQPYIITALGLSGLGTIALLNVNRNLSKKWVYSIEWDLKKEVFIIKQPKSALSS